MPEVLVALACAALVLAPAERAFADGPSTEASNDASRSEAKSKFEEGVTAFAEHRYGDAVVAFRKADAIAPSANLSFNIARSYEHLDDVPSALRWYRDFLRRSPDAPNAANVKGRVAALAAKLAERGVQQLTVLSTPAGATVFVDGQGVGAAPVTAELAPGLHHLRVELAGYRAQEMDAQVDPRTPQDFSLRLEPLAVPSAPPGTAPSAAPAAPATPGAGATPGRASADQAPPRATRPFGPAPWIVLGGGGVTMLAALGFELSRRSAESAARSAPQLEYGEHFDAMQSRQTTARVLAGVGGALLVTGGVLLVLNQPRVDSTQLAAGCAGASCGFVAMGSF